MKSMSQILGQLQAQRKTVEGELVRIDAAITALQGFGKSGVNGYRAGGPKRRFMSAAARKRIADAQRARWAKFRRAKKAA